MYSSGSKIFIITDYNVKLSEISKLMSLNYCFIKFCVLKNIYAAGNMFVNSNL